MTTPVPLTFTAHVPAELVYRDVVGAMIRSVCAFVERSRGCTGLEWRVLSAFNEAFNNLAEHGYAGRQRGQVSVFVTADAARLMLALEDDGQGFDYDACSREALPEPDALDSGGMGLFIIRRAVSDVTYQRGRPNRLTMIQPYDRCGTSASRS